MKVIESDKRQYYLLLLFPLFFSFVSLILGISGMLNPDSITTQIKGQIVETTFLNSLPLLIIGIPFLVVFIWLWTNFFLIEMHQDKIEIQNRSQNNHFLWNEIESIRPIKFPLIGQYIFRIKPKTSDRFYTISDLPSPKFSDLLSGKKRMAHMPIRVKELVDQKIVKGTDSQYL